jgi:hypothetical protein
MPSITWRVMLNSEPRLVLITAFHCSRRHLVERAVAGDAGIVDQHIDRAEVGLDLLDALGAGVERTDVPFEDGMPVSALNFSAAASLPA